FFGSKPHTRLIIEGVFFCPQRENMKPEICNMKHPITDYDRLSNITIKVYDIYIIMYFYIGTNYAKQTQFSPFIAPKRRFHQKTNPIQTQFKPNLTQNKPNLSQFQSQTNPICRKAKNERSCVENDPYDPFNSLTRGSYQP
ncbi:MAG: hypothetical protein RQ760_07800, partial [Sedimentisphaerales bacterium]|nr:hypothetical protein [Sedimentisphaerales bacterium]